MESIFPDLLFLGPYFGPLILRTALGFYLLMSAYTHWKSGIKSLAAKEALFGFLFIFGILVQLVSLVGIAFILLRGAVFKGKIPKQNWVENIVVIGILLTLLISGAGYSPFPFSDLPY